MVSERTRALLIVVAVFLVGMVVAAAVISRIRERMWQRQGDDLEAFLKNLPEKDANQSFVGAPALVFELKNDSTYVEQAPEQAKVFILTRRAPEPGFLRGVLENTPYRFFRTAKNRLVTRSEGMIVVGGKNLLVRSFRIDDGTPKAELWSTGPGGGKVGSFELKVTGEKVVQATIELDRTGERYDVIIARDHPNFTDLAQTIRGAKPLTRVHVVELFRRSYENASVVARQAPP